MGGFNVQPGGQLLLKTNDSHSLNQRHREDSPHHQPSGKWKQNHSEITPHPISVRIAIIKKIKNNKCW
jgi:hypothetical protein